MDNWGLESETRGDALFGVIAMLSGATLLIHIGVVVALPSSATFQELATYNAHQTIYALLLLTVLAFNAFAVAFIAGLGRMLAPVSSKLAAAATLPLGAGILVTGLGVVLTTGGLVELAQLPSDPKYVADAVFAGAFLANAQGLTNAFGNGLMGLGLILLGWVAWESRVVPNWLAIVSFVGGVAGVVAVVFDLATAICYLAFAIWSFAIGVLLFAGRNRTESRAAPAATVGDTPG